MPKRKSRSTEQPFAVPDVGVSLTPSVRALAVIIARLETSARQRSASQILVYTRIVRKAIEAGNPVLAALAMYDAVAIERGVRYGSMSMRNLRRRAKQRAIGSSGGKATAAVKAKRNAEMIDEALDLQRARRGRRTREIARELAKKYRLSHKTVEPIIGPALRGSGSDAT